MMNDGGEGEQMLIPEKKQNLPSRLNAKERSWRPTWVHIAKPYFKKKKKFLHFLQESLLDLLFQKTFKN